MALTLTQMYEAKARRTNSNPELLAFQEAFIEAANTCLLDMNNRLHTEAVQITSRDDNCGLDERYIPCLSAGVDYFLTVQSQFKIEGKADLDGIYQRQLRKSQHIYFDDNTPVGAGGSAVE